LEVVTPQGEVVWFGGKALDPPGYDLAGVFVGSEGTVGIATKIVVRLVPMPESVQTLLAVFETIDDASAVVSEVIGRGIVPAAIEMMDRLALKAVEAAYHAGYPVDAGAVLLVEVDGLREGLEEQAAAIADICRSHQAREVRLAASAKERELLWAGRKGAFGAMGRLSPDYYVVDGVVPRSTLPRVLQEVGEIGRELDLPIANVFHAGDGNLHPLILFDAAKPGELERVRKAGAAIMRVCLKHGGTLSGEHGIGVEKRDLMSEAYSDCDLEQMLRLKHALDPDGHCNPGKVFPTPGQCAEIVPHPVAGLGW
jgi:glycolate oxidase